MEPLQRFESQLPSIPEIESFATWDGIACLLLALQLYTAIRLYVARSIDDPFRKPRLQAWIGVLVLLFALMQTPLVGYANTIVLLGLIPLFQCQTPFWIYRILHAKAGRKALLIALSLLALPIGCFGAFLYLISYPFYLPASYPPPQRDQLRMIRRILECEPTGIRFGQPLLPLSQLHLQKENQALIPDSIRSRSEYQGYRYNLASDPKRPRCFVLDAVPISYQRGMPSFHAFASEPANTDKATYVIYCITLADRAGAPATESDRHFHKKGPWYLLTHR